MPGSRRRPVLRVSDTLVRPAPVCEHHKDVVADLLEGLAALDGIREGELATLASDAGPLIAPGGAL
jgi:hypothetical protein